METVVHLANERGLAVLSGLRGLIVGLVVFGVLVFDVGAIIANAFQLDDLTGRAAFAAATAWRSTGAYAPVLRAVDDVVDEQAEVHDVEITNDHAVVSLRRPPPALVLDRVPPLRERLVLTVTHEVPLDPERS